MNERLIQNKRNPISPKINDTVPCSDKTPEERAEIKKKYATKSEVSEAQELIRAKAQDMLRHYLKHILPNGFKAQVVVTSRLAAVRYYEALTNAKNYPSAAVRIS